MNVTIIKFIENEVIYYVFILLLPLENMTSRHAYLSVWDGIPCTTAFLWEKKKSEIRPVIDSKGVLPQAVYSPAI